MGLTVQETKALKLDMELMRKLLEEGIADRDRPREIMPVSAQQYSNNDNNNNNNNSNSSSPAQSSNYHSQSQSENNSHNNQCGSSIERGESAPVAMDPELVVKIVQGGNLNNDEKDQKKRLLSALRLPAEEVAVSRIRIGQGGFGDVFLGTYRRKYKVAIKAIRNLDTDPYAENKKKSIENELLLMKFLGSYPTILTCFGYVNKEDSLQIVLELAPFGSLDHMIRDKTNFPQGFPVALSIAWLSDLADAIKFLHSREIKHRDIKAENMLVFERFRIKLCDFGPAKQHLANVTAESKVGTFCFMAPEIRVGHVSEFSSDIFSFAMTAIQILTRKTPKIDDFNGQIMETIKQFPLSKEQPEINERMIELLVSCVQYDPHINPNQLRPTAEMLFHELHALLSALGGDPRDEDHFEGNEMIRSLESVAQKKESERLKSISRSGSMFRPQNSASSHSMSQSLSRKNSLAISNEQLFKQQSFEDMNNNSNPNNHNNNNPNNVTLYTTHTNVQGAGMNGFPLSPASAGMVRNNSASSLFAMSFGSQDFEDKNLMVKYFQSTVGGSVAHPAQAQLVADMLIKNGVANIDILRRRLQRNEEFLLDLGVDEQTADEIYQGICGQGQGRGQQANYSSTSSRKSYGSNHKRRNALSPSSSFSGAAFFSSEGVQVLPTEVSRLYYDAAQCNRTEALDRLQEIANQGDSLAECFLMRMYAMGQGAIKKDLAKAQEMGNRLLPWLKEAMDSGNELSQMYVKYLVGVCYAEGLGTRPDQREAVRWCKQSAEQGFAAAQAYLGFCYFSGAGVPRNLEEAVRWYRMAADQGYGPAQCNLGLCFEHGYGVFVNGETAVKWYSLAADQGDAAALFNLGFCYEKGIGVEENMRDAIRFYKLSAGYGYTAAQYNLGVCYYFGTGVEQNMEEAVTWYRIAADKGYAPAQCNLGLCYENGHGIERDYVEAVYWYRASAEQGHPAALYYLGFCYFSGMGISKNVEEAVHFYKQAGEKKYPPALNNLGFCYFNGLGVPKNYSTAVKYYRQSAELGYAPAQYNMGYCYEKGYGVVAKLQSIIQWYRLAAENGNEKAKKALYRFQI
jgi:TPR repeat protein/serine/threonine protein kinase